MRTVEQYVTDHLGDCGPPPEPAPWCPEHGGHRPPDADHCDDVHTLLELVETRDVEVQVATLTETLRAWQAGGGAAITEAVRSGSGPAAVLATARAVTGWLRGRLERLELHEETEQ